MNIDLHKKIGILGGGQLGRMLQEVALRYGVDIYFLDSDIKAPCSIFKNNFTHGSVKDFNSVIQFGKEKDILSIEIEHVNAEALEQLIKYDIEVIPSVESIKLIKNKALQKQFYEENKIPTSPFVILDNKQISKELAEEWYPFVQKTQTDGYDGKGVAVISDENELVNQLGEVSILEKKVDITKELAITIAIERSGAIHFYPIVEMAFNPVLNLVDYLFAPAQIDGKYESEIKKIAEKIGKELNSAGIFSIEFFLTSSGEILVNEIAPRTHNSAHYTIEGTTISQFEAQLRILLHIPIPEIKMKGYAGMVNIIGEENQQGIPQIENLDTLSELENTFIHLYGKKETKPGRKMGHVTVLNSSKDKLIKQLMWVRDRVKVVARN
jgi:5-(carboxyamino)imidazole ribonucleotide synthase